MVESVKEHKANMRKEMLSKRAFLDKHLKAQYDNSICEKLWGKVEQHRYQVIHVYIPMASEIDITSFIQRCLENDLTVVAPKTLKGRQLKHLRLRSLAKLEAGVFGTKHPAGDEEFVGEIDMIVVPGLAFDNLNYRLGYGAGYYDNFLIHQLRAKKIAIAYPFQIVSKVPIESHDVSLDEILTCPDMVL